jgi:hypothetical protein
MNHNNREAANDPTEDERRKNLSDEQIEELELAGGVEGGMRAGSAGGPSESDVQIASPDSKQRPGR